MPDDLTYSVIVPTFNRGEMLGDSLRSIAAQSWPSDDMEILVVNNASTDETPEVVAKIQAACPDVSIRLLDEKRPGLSFGRNTGVQAARGRLLVLTDDDVDWDREVLVSLHAAFEDSEVVGATGCTLAGYEAEVPAWVRWLWLDQPFGTCCGTYSLLEGDTACDIAPDWMFGVHLALRKSAVMEVQGFPTDSTPASFQRWQGDGETGLCRELARRGGRFRFVPGSRIIHRIPASRLSLDFIQRRMFFQGIVNSYSELRQGGEAADNSSEACGDNGTGMGSPLKTMSHLILRDRKLLAEIVRYRSGQMMSRFRFLRNRVSARRKFLRQLTEWELAGYHYHQAEVAGDPDLLAWVRREHYLDADYPPEAYEPGAIARSY